MRCVHVHFTNYSVFDVSLFTSLLRVRDRHALLSALIILFTVINFVNVYEIFIYPDILEPKKTTAK